AWLNHLLMPYIAQMGILPETQIASHQGVQARDLTSFLAGLQCWAHRSKTTIFALKRDQMKGFDHLAPQGFYDAITAYGLPDSIIARDKAANAQNHCTIRTAYGFTDPIVIDGVTPQGASLSPFKSALTTSLGNRYLHDISSDNAGALIVRSQCGARHEIHTPDDALALRIAMIEATDDSYIFARDRHALSLFCGRLNFLNTDIDNGKATYELLRDTINNFALPKFHVRTPITLLRKLIEQNIISKARARLSLQPIQRSDAHRLDSLISTLVHNSLRFKYPPSPDILTLPIAFHGLGFSSIERINDSIAIDGLARDLNHQVPAYRLMARITLADWTCTLNDCVHPFHGQGFQSSTSHKNGIIPRSSLTAHEAMRTLNPQLSLLPTDVSYIYNGSTHIKHIVSILSKQVVHSVSGHGLRSLAARGFSSLSDFGSWSVGLHDWASDGSMIPAAAACHEQRSVTSAITGPATAVFSISGRASSILHGEVFAQIAALTVAGRDRRRIRRMNARSYYRWLFDLAHQHCGVGLQPVYTPGHSDAVDLPAALNGFADHYATQAQVQRDRLPAAPVPSFAMDDYTFWTAPDGWVESSMRDFYSHHRARQQGLSLAVGHGGRMALSLYASPRPDYPYTRAYASYSAAVQLYARSGQLPTARTLADRNRSILCTSPMCRYGCIAIEDDYHVLVICPRHAAFRRESAAEL
ncbi:hypothetical protein EXIGLDRAFT_590403, partial [Exidia glandulosa HHB12029]